MNERIEKELKTIEENKMRAVNALRELAFRIEADDVRLSRISSTHDIVNSELRIEYQTKTPPIVTRKIGDFTHG